MRIQYRLATLFLPIVFCAALCRIFFVQPPVPRLFTQPDFDTTDLIDAVNHYVRLGEARSTNQLKELAENHQSTEFNVRERIRWVSRILYLNKTEYPQCTFLTCHLLRPPARECLGYQYPATSGQFTHLPNKENRTSCCTKEIHRLAIWRT